jgi:hypothetical protein
MMSGKVLVESYSLEAGYLRSRIPWIQALYQAWGSRESLEISNADLEFLGRGGPVERWTSVFQNQGVFTLETSAGKRSPIRDAVPYAWLYVRVLDGDHFRFLRGVVNSTPGRFYTYSQYLQLEAQAQQDFMPGELSSVPRARVELRELPRCESLMDDMESEAPDYLTAMLEGLSQVRHVVTRVPPSSQLIEITLHIKPSQPSPSRLFYFNIEGELTTFQFDNPLSPEQAHKVQRYPEWYRFLRAAGDALGWEPVVLSDQEREAKPSLALSRCLELQTIWPTKDAESFFCDRESGRFRRLQKVGISSGHESGSPGTSTPPGSNTASASESAG